MTDKIESADSAIRAAYQAVLDRAYVAETERDELRAENERLRVALVKALELIGDLDYDEYSKADEAAEILRAALGSDQRPL